MPVRHFLCSTLATQAQHTAFGHQGLDAGDTQLGGLFDQPVHAFIGRHAHGKMQDARCLSLDDVMHADAHLHFAATHALDAGFKLATLAPHIRSAVEQGDTVARLQAQDLHVARRIDG